jgi:restriction endonuclease S subunit
MAALGRNAWQLRPGTGGNFPPEWVADLARNTHDSQVKAIYLALPGKSVQERVSKEIKSRFVHVFAARAAAQARLEAIRALPAAYLREVFPDRGEELLEGWEWARLGDCISESQAGFASGARDDNGVIQLRMNNVTTDGTFKWSEYLRVPCDASDIARYSLLRDDVLFNNTNSTELVGKSALFGNYSEPVVYSNHFTRLRTKPLFLHPAYLAYWLNHQWRKCVFADICNRWIGQSAVKMDMLFKLEIPIPSLKEQEQIVKKLNISNEKIKCAHLAAESELAAIEALPASILRKAFNGEL